MSFPPNISQPGEPVGDLIPVGHMGDLVPEPGLGQVLQQRDPLTDTCDSRVYEQSMDAVLRCRGWYSRTTSHVSEPPTRA